MDKRTVTKKETKKETLPPVLYQARVRRNEVNGDFYNIGDKTPLDGLTDAQKGFVLARFYYVPLDWGAVPPAVKAAYEAAQ